MTSSDPLSDPLLSFIRDPRLSAHATSAAPVWLWAADGTCILWANAAGAALFGAPHPQALTERRLSADQPLAIQVIRLAGTLPHSSSPRLERLRGIGAGIGRTVACACSRLSLANGAPAILIAAAEPVGPGLPLVERIGRLFAACRTPLAAFAADGALIHATPEAAARLCGRTSLAALGADRLAADALHAGRASGGIGIGSVTIERIGTGAATVLVVIFAPPLKPVEPADAPGEPATTPSASADPAPPAAERRHPLRFVWQLDTDGLFTFSDEFAHAMGPHTMALVGRKWSDVSGQLALDPEQRFEHAVGSRDTFSGVHVAWPVEGTDERVAVELSGLPMFDRDRAFRGYRGFGVCRDMGRLGAAMAARRTEPGPPPDPPASAPTAALAEPAARAAAPPPEAAVGEPSAQPASPPPAPESRPILTVVPAAKNVVPFRAGAAVSGDKRAILSPVERTAFREIAKVLGVGSEGEPTAPLPTTPEPSPIAPQSAAAAGATDDVGTPAAPIETHAEPPPSAPAPPVEPPAVDAAGGGDQSSELARRAAEAENRELRSILDTATDGVIVVQRDGRILALNRSAEALFGYESHDLRGYPFADLFAPESHRAALDYLDGLTRNGVASVLNDGREVIGRVRQGGLIPLFMTMGRIGEEPDKFCAVLRDITQWKRAEEELLNAKRQAEKASSAKSDFLAKISHEIRTPLNAIIGFSEVMMEERFGPIGNERYREYVKDVHDSGGHLVSLINDLLDLSKIEAGKLDLTFTSVNLNALVQQCVALMQPQANREHIIIRTSLAPTLPPIVVDARSIRQIVLNLLSNSIKFTGAGGQVIVSTALTDRGEAVLRVRDTGVGMSEKEIETALEPFRQLATSTRWGSGGTGLGLPLTKALAEANRATFAIKSAVNAGTLVEITFPATRVLAE